MKKIDYYMKLDYPLVIVPYENEWESGYNGYLYDIPAIGYYGDSEEEVLQEIEDVKREWFTHALEEGIPIPEPYTSFPKKEDVSGKLTLRLPKSLHSAIIVAAKNDGVSLNTYLINLLQKGLTNLNLEAIEKELHQIEQYVRHNTEHGITVSEKMDTSYSEE